MMQLRAAGSLTSCALLLVGLATSLSAQDEDRIYARVRTTTGDTHEGFVRWDRNEGSWVDILDGSKDIPLVNYHAWLRARGDDGPPVRTVELMGYLISWNESDKDFPPTSSSGIRFGHLTGLRVLDDDRVELVLRSGESIEMENGTSDLGRGIRELIVETPDGEVDLDWEDLESVDFLPVPSGRRASARRLYGTATDDTGRRFTGYIAWDLDEILESDRLDGDEMQGRRDRSIPFGDIETIARIERGARVRLRDGRTLDLTGSNDVDRGHRGVQISDPELGMVEIEWRDFGSILFHPAETTVDYHGFDGGGPLYGIVRTAEGEAIEGFVRWDADEGETWEMLDGYSEGVRFAIELAKVASITRSEDTGARVALRDGRAFDLDGGTDLTFRNKGILIAAPSGPPPLGNPGAIAPPDRAEAWRVVDWEDFASLKLLDPSTQTDGRSPER